MTTEKMAILERKVGSLTQPQAAMIEAEAWKWGYMGAMTRPIVRPDTPDWEEYEAILYHPEIGFVFIFDFEEWVSWRELPLQFDLTGEVVEQHIRRSGYWIAG